MAESVVNESACSCRLESSLMLPAYYMQACYMQAKTMHHFYLSSRGKGGDNFPSINI